MRHEENQECDVSKAKKRECLYRKGQISYILLRTPAKREEAAIEFGQIEVTGDTEKSSFYGVFGIEA